MDGGEDWLLRPVSEGLCRYESLRNCELDLADVDLLNEMIDVRNENRYRADVSRSKK